jgi:hypothetical protein
MRREEWSQLWTLLVLGGVLFGLVGCASRTIYIPHGEPVRLRETIPVAKVWVLNAKGEPVPGVVTLHEGWWALPEPEVEVGK